LVGRIFSGDNESAADRRGKGNGNDGYLGSIRERGKGPGTKGNVAEVIREQCTVKQAEIKERYFLSGETREKEG